MAPVVSSKKVEPVGGDVRETILFTPFVASATKSRVVTRFVLYSWVATISSVIYLIVAWGI
jgi:hypothetical protein